MATEKNYGNVEKAEEIIDPESPDDVTEINSQTEEIKFEEFIDDSKHQKHTTHGAHTSEGIKTLEEEIKGLKDQALRRLAEFDNYRKRVEADRQEYLKYAQEKTLLDLLPILDSFERAMQATTEESKKVYEGFGLIYKQFTDFLTKQGVVEMVTVGEAFNPELHQAVSSEEVEGQESGLVVKEFQKGYLFHKKVLRHAMVVVTQ